MKPPAQPPRTASRKQAKRSVKKSGSGSRRPKRLINKENGDTHTPPGKAPSLFVSSEVTTALNNNKKPSPVSVLTPSSFNLSYGSEINDEVLFCLDQLDGNFAATCSTPLTVQRSSSHTTNQMNSSCAPLFDCSSPYQTKESLILRNSDLPSNRSSFLTTPAKSVKNHLSLSSWGLPEKVLEQYAQRGITSMFEWQAECLMMPDVLTGGNLVYSAPTSAGKTLVAELLALKCVLELKKKVIIILPFVSIAHEKSNYLRQILEPVGVKVGGFMGGQSPSGGFAAVDIAICTIEKANSLINHLLEEKSTHQLGLMIVDELHMIGDSHRGYLLELLLTKLMYVGKKQQAMIPDPLSIVNEASTIQLIGMSATLPNLDMLASWLGAQLYHTDFRPVPLKEMVKIGATLYTTDFKKITEYDSSESLPGDEDDILPLCRERVTQGHSVLIFCPTKAWCENLSNTLAGALVGLIKCKDERGIPMICLDTPALVGVCEQLRKTQVGLDRVLEKTVPYGVAFHHAGLTFEEREIIEGSFRSCQIKILVATSTLSSGVNLPARLVIVRTPFFQRSLLDVLVYKQMVGRAGRKGVDDSGESILICKESERSKVVGLMKSAPKPVQSCLGRLEKGGAKGSKDKDLTAMKRAILEVVTSGSATSKTEIEMYTSCTLLYAELEMSLNENGKPTFNAENTASANTTTTTPLIQSTVEFLLKNEFIRTRQKSESKKDRPSSDSDPPDVETNPEYYATQLGMATVASALSPDEALVVFSELRKARRCFVLENELHIIYLVTPVYIQNQWPNIDWYKYLCLWERLPSSMRHVGDVLGVKESFLAKAVQGRVPERTPAQKESLRIHRRFFTALALHDLVHEVPLIHVARRYGVTKGLLQTLQSAAGTFAGMVTVFCSRLGWKNLELLLSQFQSRLLFGVERELCDLVKISLLNGFRARVLYNAGFHTIAALATANPIAVESCLRNALPFKSYKHVGDEDTEPDCSDPSDVCTTWCAKLRKGLSESEAARMIVHEAQVILSDELNVPISAWNVQRQPPPLPAQSKPDVVSSSSSISHQAANNDHGIHVQSKSEQTAKRSLADGIAALRGHRKSPNHEVPQEDNVVKKQCMESKPLNTQRHQQTHVLSEMVPETHTLQTSCVNAGQLSSNVPCSSFIPASSLLKENDNSKPLKNESSTPLPAVSKAKKSGNMYQRCVEFSPIIAQQYIHVQTDIQTNPPMGPMSNLLSPVPASSHAVAIETDMAAAVEVQLQPPDANDSLTIPDSLPCSMNNMSMSFSFHTYAMIDAACTDAQTNSTPCIEVVRNTSLTSQGLKPDDLMDSQSIELFQNSHHVTKDRNVHTNANATGNSTANVVAGATAFSTPHSKTPVLIAETPPPPATASLSQINGLKELSSLCSSQLTQSGVTIIDVTSNKTLFETFVTECMEQEAVSFSMATSNVDQSNGIGSTIIKPREATGIALPFRNEQVVGVAFCWGDMDVYYVSLCDSSSQGGGEITSIPLTTRVKAVQEIFRECTHREKLIAYDIKKYVKMLALACDSFPMGKTLDPVVANWMLDPDAKEKTIHRMVLQYLPDQPMLSEDEDCVEMPLSSVATHSTDPQMRSSAESILAFLLMSKIEPLLKKEDLYSPFIQVEMPSVLILAKMELNGIGFSSKECCNQRDILQSRVTELERSAYLLAQHTFSLTSPEDIATVLFVELKLPSGQEKQPKTLAPKTRRAAKKRVQHLSTAKDVLEKIRPLHPLPGIVLEWRQISSTIVKMVYPLFKEAVGHDEIQSTRIHPNVQYHTATGRVSVSDPNLQMVPKEFDIGSHSSPNHNSGVDSLLSDSQCLQEAQLSRDHATIPSSVCMRNVFEPFRGGIFLAADYSQLELRMLAHMSDDVKLKKYLNSDGDVFKMIASEWLGVPASEVSDKQRQETKQVCYGMLYGIGSKALAEQLGIGQEDAVQFIETFKSKYPMMKKFLTKTVQDCRENGYVSTLLGRKRFLQSIHSTNVHARSQAERQAVNTTIQGSAADLVKTAMVNIDNRLKTLYPHSPLSLTQHNSPLSTSTGGSSAVVKLSGAYLVLQLHDELLYEVAGDDLKDVARVVKHEMENALEMSVKFPVKMKTGYSWGTLESYSL